MCKREKERDRERDEMEMVKIVIYIQNKDTTMKKRKNSQRWYQRQNKHKENMMGKKHDRQKKHKKRRKEWNLVRKSSWKEQRDLAENIWEKINKDRAMLLTIFPCGRKLGDSTHHDTKFIIKVINQGIINAKVDNFL